MSSTDLPFQINEFTVCVSNKCFRSISNKCSKQSCFGTLKKLNYPVNHCMHYLKCVVHIPNRHYYCHFLYKTCQVFNIHIKMAWYFKIHLQSGYYILQESLLKLQLVYVRTWQPWCNAKYLELEECIFVNYFDKQIGLKGLGSGTGLRLTVFLVLLTTSSLNPPKRVLHEIWLKFGQAGHVGQICSDSSRPFSSLMLKMSSRKGMDKIGN